MLQLLYIMARESETPLLISCVTDTMPGIKRGMFRDFKRMLQDEGVWDDKCMNLTDSIYSLENGSQIEFFGCEDSSKVFGPARDILFVNEAQRVPFEVFRQMAVRTRLCSTSTSILSKVLGTRLLQRTGNGRDREHLQGQSVLDSRTDRGDPRETGLTRIGGESSVSGKPEA